MCILWGVHVEEEPMGGMLVPELAKKAAGIQIWRVFDLIKESQNH